MFKKLKDKLEEEFKQGPLKFPVSVQQLAQVISPSPSLNSLSDNNASSSVTYTSDPSNVSTDFFSIGDDDDSQDGSVKTLPLQSIDLTATSPSNMTQNRSRRSSLSSVTSDASSLFPIYENPSGQNYFQSDLESEMEDGMPSQIEKISKEQLYQSYKKVFNRYNKYKGRYVDLHRHYKELLHDNVKTKNVLQESQDKALRRIAELKEQCQLEQNAKAHLEESLRNDVEDRDHMITTLKTKISLLRSGGGSDGLLVDINDKDGQEDFGENKNKVYELEKLKLENENLQKEITDLKKLKETACHLIHRCDTTIDEATEDVNNENLKRKMSELKSEIQKMKSENESLSHLLSRNIIMEEDRKSQNNLDNNFLIDLSNADSSQSDKADEKDRKIEKLNNLLLKCKEKISTLNVEIKSKNLIIEDKSKRLKEVTEEVEANKKSVSNLMAEVEALKKREEDNVISVAENKMAIHKELETKEEQIRALTKELKTSENEFRKEKDEIIKKYEDKLKEMTEDFTRELKYKKEENEKLSEYLKAKTEPVSDAKDDDSVEKVKEWEREFKIMLEAIMSGRSYEGLMESKSAEIERASLRLEERLSAIQGKVMDLIQTKQMELEDSGSKLKKIIENKDRTINEISSLKAEHDGKLEKLNSEIGNLRLKIEELESSLEESERRAEKQIEEKNMVLAEKEKLMLETKNLSELRDRVKHLENENEKMKTDWVTTAAENKRLNEELSDQSEKLKSAEGESCLLEKINREKTEAEKKLDEYIEKYKKLEKENEMLESDLSQKCDKMVKDLNDSKEKIKMLENENKTRGSEIERLKNVLTEAEANKSEMMREREKLSEELREVKGKLEETESSREELDDVKTVHKVLNEQYEKATEELNCLKKEHSDVVSEKLRVEEENMRLKSEMKLTEEKIREGGERTTQIESDLREQLSGKDSELERVKNELSLQLDIIKKYEAKLENESKVNSQLRDKLQEELKAKESLEKEIKELNSKYEHLEVELRKIEREYENEKCENSKLKEAGLERNDLLKETENLSKELEATTAKVEELMGVNKETSRELEELKSELKGERAENDKLKLELLESEKTRLEVTEKMKEVLKEKNEISDSLEIKWNELETLKSSLSSTKEELTAKVRALEEEKIRLTSESENKLNILKNEIKFMNNKFEEDIGNIEENRSVEMNELNSRLEVAEKTSGELLEKLERITSERDEAKAAVEERDMKIMEMENCMSTFKTDLDQKCNEGKAAEISEKHQQEMAALITRYESEMMNREEEIHSLQNQLLEYKHLIENVKSASDMLKSSGNKQTFETEEGKGINENGGKDGMNKFVEVDLQDSDKNLKEVEEVYEKENVQLCSSEKVEVSGEIVGDEPASLESIQKKFIQQAAEMKELKKQHKREVAELRKIISVKRKSRRNSAESPDWGGTLDNDTEHEYLRNILYEYMMGREQLVLAKVLSAIVKFDKQQTRNVLEKEQHRQTLFGQLGIL